MNSKQRRKHRRAELKARLGGMRVLSDGAWRRPLSLGEIERIIKTEIGRAHRRAWGELVPITADFVRVERVDLVNRSTEVTFKMPIHSVVITGTIEV